MCLLNMAWSVGNQVVHDVPDQTLEGGMSTSTSCFVRITGVELSISCFDLPFLAHGARTGAFALPAQSQAGLKLTIRAAWSDLQFPPTMQQDAICKI